MFWFQGLFVGNTWQPPRIVRGPDGAGGFAEVVRAVGRGVALAVAVASAEADADVVGEPGVGDVPRVPPPEGVGTACVDVPPQAVATMSELASAMPSRRRGAWVRSRITALASPDRGRRS
jgi:hypothetical protein